jgi:hypothetical protein
MCPTPCTFEHEFASFSENDALVLVHLSIDAHDIFATLHRVHPECLRGSIVTIGTHAGAACGHLHFGH